MPGLANADSIGWREVLKKVAKTATKFFSDIKGNVAVSFGLAATVLVGLGGGVIDYTKQSKMHSQLQAIADGAVLVSAKELQLSGPAGIQNSRATAVAQEYVTRNIKADMGAPTLAVNVAAAQGLVDLTLTGQVHTPFLSMIGLTGTKDVTVKTTARVLGGLPLCVLALEETDGHAINATNSAKLTATGCTVHSNSGDTSSIEAWGQSLLKTGLTCSVGGASGGTANFDPAAVTDCPAVEDPLAARPSPVSPACDFTNFEVTNGNRTLTPGVYCGGIRITGNANVNLLSGVYTLKDGGLELTENSQSSGEYVTFYFSGNDSKLGIYGNARANFSAMKTGPSAGILMYENRNNANPVTHEITSRRVESLVGTIYFPLSEFRVSINGGGGGQVAQQSAFTVIISKILTLNGQSNLVLNTDYAATDVPLPESVSRLSGEIVLAR